MRDVLLKLSSFNAVGPGQTANMSLPVGGPVYEAIHIRHKFGAASALATKAQIKANLTKIVVKVNGEMLIDLTGKELQELNDFYKYPFKNGYLSIPFIRPEFLNANEELRYALGTVGIRQLSIEITLAAGLINPSLDAWAQITPGVQRPMGQVIRVRSTTQSAQAAAGLREIHDLPVVGPEIGRGIKALHIQSGKITEHEILRQGTKITESTKELLTLVQNFRSYRTGGRTGQTGYYHIDFAGDRASGIVSTQDVSDFRLKLTFSGIEAAFKVISEETIGAADI